jgi:hypothetical protein
MQKAVAILAAIVASANAFGVMTELNSEQCLRKVCDQCSLLLYHTLLPLKHALRFELFDLSLCAS